ncbi:hypothetical protein GOP47_0027855 [Adiantum capillus-veneris]|nr:hypothetical protein GOP47_0027855 [Adiantum capillus-veneris]
MRQRWAWVMDKFRSKLNRWIGLQANIAGRVLVLNHFISAYLLFFLCCWRPPDSHIREAIKVCRNFLWSGDPFKRGAAKVKWDVCTLPKSLGGLGVRDLGQWADKLSSKLVIRALDHLEAEWARLLFRNLKLFHIKGDPKWNDLPWITIFFRSEHVSSVGSHLIKSIWEAWNRYRSSLRYSSTSRKGEIILKYESIWWSKPPIPPITAAQLRTARRIHKKGLQRWMDLWNADSHSWYTGHQLLTHFQLQPWEVLLIERRISDFPLESSWIFEANLEPTSKDLCWQGGAALTNPPDLIKPCDPPLHVTLNRRWHVSWDRKQWNFKFSSIWHRHIQPKQSVLMWLIILHKALWTGEKQRNTGLGDGICPRCQQHLEDIPHLFINCPSNLIILAPLFKTLGYVPSWKQFLLREGTTILHEFWQRSRAEFLWVLWTYRNNHPYGNVGAHQNLKSIFFGCNVQASTLLMSQLRIYRNRMAVLGDAMQFYCLQSPQAQQHLVDNGTLELMHDWLMGLVDDVNDLAVKYADAQFFI